MRTNLNLIIQFHLNKKKEIILNYLQLNKKIVLFFK